MTINKETVWNSCDKTDKWKSSLEAERVSYDHRLKNIEKINTQHIKMKKKLATEHIKQWVNRKKIELKT